MANGANGASFQALLFSMVAAALLGLATLSFENGGGVILSSSSSSSSIPPPTAATMSRGRSLRGRSRGGGGAGGPVAASGGGAQQHQGENGGDTTTRPPSSSSSSSGKIIQKNSGLQTAAAVFTEEVGLNEVKVATKTTRRQGGGGMEEGEWRIPWRISQNPAVCGVQPNETRIDPYKGCPLPGLNNLLYTQTNRWFCAYRDSAGLELRDRTCDKGSVTPFRFSSIIHVDYAGAAAARSRSAAGQLNKAAPRICWSDIKKQQEAKNCAWKDIPSFYGKPEWWTARKFFDFQPKYYEAAAKYISHHFQDEPFISVHLRRGDYFTHCVSVRKKHTPAWLPFTAQGSSKLIKSLADLDPKRAMAPKIDHNGNPMPGVHSNCYPTVSEIEDHFTRIRQETGIKHIFLATNLPEEFSKLTTSHGVHFFHPEGDVDATPSSLRFTADRKLDLMILEMAIASQGNFFIFNKYSSFSGSIYEMARIHGKVEDKLSNVVVW